MKRFKRVILLSITFAFLISVFCCAFEVPENRQLPLLFDAAELLTKEEKTELFEKLQSVTKKRSCDIAVVTVESLEGYSTATAYAEDFFDYYGYGYGDERDGILLLISMAEREWVITLFGYAVTAFPETAYNKMTDDMSSHLTEGEYYEAFCIYVDFCEQNLDSEGSTNYNPTKKSAENSGILFSTLRLVFAIIAGLFLSWLTLQKHIHALKTVARKHSASDYVRKGSMNLTGARDVFLYRTRKVTPRNGSSSHSRSTHSSRSSVHTSASGRTHGSSHGKF